MVKRFICAVALATLLGGCIFNDAVSMGAAQQVFEAARKEGCKYLRKPQTRDDFLKECGNAFDLAVDFACPVEEAE